MMLPLREGEQQALREQVAARRADCSRRRNPPFADHKEAGYAFGSNPPYSFAPSDRPQRFAAGASVCTLQLDAASEAWACGIRPGSGASAFMTISPVAVGESMISRSAAVTSSSSGRSLCWASVIRSSSITFLPAERSLMA